MKTQTLTAGQCRAARAFLNWSQPELAARCALTVNPIVNFEKDGGAKPAARTLNRIVRAFVLAGIVFTSTGGVERANTLVTVLEGADANTQLLDDILHSLKAKGGEVLIAGLSEPGDDSPLRDFIASHIERLQGANISERILIEAGDTNLIAPQAWYRWVAGEEFSPTPFQLYGDKLAMIDWGPPQQITILHHPLYARTFRSLFEQVWHASQPVLLSGGSD